MVRAVWRAEWCETLRFNKPTGDSIGVLNRDQRIESNGTTRSKVSQLGISWQLLQAMQYPYLDLSVLGAGRDLDIEKPLRRLLPDGPGNDLLTLDVLNGSWPI